MSDENDSTLLNTQNTLDLSQLLQSQPTYKQSSKETLITLMRCAWINERNCIDLLLYEDGIVDSVKNKLQDIDDELNELQSSAQQHNIIHDMIITVRRVECERLRYMLYDYLRCRIKKIELYSLYIFINRNIYDTLSQHEQTYCRSLLDLWGEHVDTVVLSKLHDKFRSLTNSKLENHADMACGPDIHTFTFIQVVDDIGVVQLADDDEVELNQGDIILASYNAFRNFIGQDKVEMI